MKHKTLWVILKQQQNSWHECQGRAAVVISHSRGNLCTMSWDPSSDCLKIALEMLDSPDRTSYKKSAVYSYNWLISLRYISSKVNRFIFRVGVSSPPGTEKSLGTTIHLLTCATCDTDSSLALSIPAWMEALTWPQKGPSSTSWNKTKKCGARECLLANLCLPPQSQLYIHNFVLSIL